MAGCSGRQLHSIAPPHQNEISLWSKTESRVLLSAILAATSSSCDQRDGESSNYDWNGIHSHCQQQGVHKEVRELRQQWKQLQEDYAKLANDRSTADKVNVVQQIDPSNDALFEIIDVEIYDAIQTITGNQSAPPPPDPTSSTASKQLIQPCECTEGSAPPIWDPSPSPSPSPSGGKAKAKGKGKRKRKGKGKAKAKAIKGEGRSGHKPPPFKPGPVSGPH